MELVKVRRKQRSFEEVRLRERGKKPSQEFFLFNKYSKQTDHPVHPFASSVKLQKNFWPFALFLFFPRTVCELGL